MSSIPSWQIKQLLQSQTPQEHLADTEADALRPHMLQGVAENPAYQGMDMGERFLHAYLNDCRAGRTKEWYQAMQVGFVQYHMDWVRLFDTVLATPREQGSKKQKANIMGDWLALSLLQGAPLPFTMLGVNKRRDPRQPEFPLQPTDEIAITVAVPKDGLYKEAFELLYIKHNAEHNGWMALLRRMDLKSMTRAIWDLYVDLYPNETELPLKSMVQRSYEWQEILEEFTTARHALALNRVMVKLMQTGRADELYSQLSEESSYIKPESPLHNKYMSEALYETLTKSPDVRQKFGVQHVVHILNTDPRRVTAELNYAVSGKANAHASRDIVVTEYFSQLLPEARSRLMSDLGGNPQKYSPVLDLLFSLANEITLPEIAAVLRHSYAKASLVGNMLSGMSTSFLTKIAISSVDMSADLFATDFRVPHAFENVVMKHLTPELSYVEAAKLLAIANSLGADEQMTREMLQTAFDGASSPNSLPIEGLVDDLASTSSFSA